MRDGKKQKLALLIVSPQRNNTVFLNTIRLVKSGSRVVLLVGLLLDGRLGCVTHQTCKKSRVWYVGHTSKIRDNNRIVHNLFAATHELYLGCIQIDKGVFRTGLISCTKHGLITKRI